MFLNSTVRTDWMQDIIDRAGASATLKYYNGTQPAAGGALSGNTLLATLTFGATIGTASAGVLNWDEAGASQTAASHVNGTPTFCRLETSGGTLIADFAIPSDGTFTGTIATGVNITLGTWTITAGHSA